MTPTLPLIRVFRGFSQTIFTRHKSELIAQSPCVDFFGPLWFGCGDDLHLDNVLMKLHTKRLGVIEPLAFKKKKKRNKEKKSTLFKEEIM